MSYAKAMKHSRNVRKVRKQANMHFGFDTGSGPWPSFRGTPEGGAIMHIRDWFQDRHRDKSPGRSQYMRECIREQTKGLRDIREIQTLMQSPTFGVHQVPGGFTVADSSTPSVHLFTEDTSV